MVLSGRANDDQAVRRQDPCFRAKSPMVIKWANDDHGLRCRPYRLMACGEWGSRGGEARLRCKLCADRVHWRSAKSDAKCIRVCTTRQAKCSGTVRIIQVGGICRARLEAPPAMKPPEKVGCPLRPYPRSFARRRRFRPAWTWRDGVRTQLDHGHVAAGFAPWREKALPDVGDEAMPSGVPLPRAGIGASWTREPGKNQTKFKKYA